MLDRRTKQVRIRNNMKGTPFSRKDWEAMSKTEESRPPAPLVVNRVMWERIREYVRKYGKGGKDESCT